MAIPNLVSVLMSIPLIRRLQREFFARRRRHKTVLPAATLLG